MLANLHRHPSLAAANGNAEQLEVDFRALRGQLGHPDGGLHFPAYADFFVGADQHATAAYIDGAPALEDRPTLVSKAEFYRPVYLESRWSFNHGHSDHRAIVICRQ